LVAHLVILESQQKNGNANLAIVGPFRNGDAVLFNEKVLTAQVNFSLRTSFVLLPEDGFCFINKNTREEYQVDFYDPKEWVKYAFSPCGTYGNYLPYVFPFIKDRLCPASYRHGYQLQHCRFSSFSAENS
jgi:hypothetical protein